VSLCVYLSLFLYLFHTQRERGGREDKKRERRRGRREEGGERERCLTRPDDRRKRFHCVYKSIKFPSSNSPCNC
jgi:hypothetical protein